MLDFGSRSQVSHILVGLVSLYKQNIRKEKFGRSFFAMFWGYLIVKHGESNVAPFLVSMPE